MHGWRRFFERFGSSASISHAIGAEYDTHHGLTNAITLPAVMRFNAASIRDKCPEISQALNLEARDFDAVYHWICQLLDHLEIPPSLDEIGVNTSKVNSLQSELLATVRPQLTQESHSLRN